MAEKAVSFRIVSPRIMITGIETMTQHIFFAEKVFFTVEIQTEITQSSDGVSVFFMAK